MFWALPSFLSIPGGPETPRLHTHSEHRILTCGRMAIRISTFGTLKASVPGGHPVGLGFTPETGRLPVLDSLAPLIASGTRISIATAPDAEATPSRTSSQAEPVYEF